MFAPWRSQKSVHKQKELISGNLFNVVFEDLGSLHMNPVNFRCVHIRGWPGSVTDISVFLIGISVSGLEIFAI